MGVFHGGVDGLGEEKADADFADGARGIGWRYRDLDAKCFKHVRAAATAARRAVAVLGDMNARAGNYQRHQRGNIEGALSIAAGAAGIEQHSAGKANVDRHGHFPHGAGEADQFIHGGALHSQPHQERGQLRCTGLAGENQPHGGL